MALVEVCVSREDLILEI